MAARDDLARLRGLAGDMGYTVERAVRRSHWRLTDESGLPVVDPKTGATALTIEAATRFLGEVKSAPPVSGRPKLGSQTLDLMAHECPLSTDLRKSLKVGSTSEMRHKGT